MSEPDSVIQAHGILVTHLATVRPNRIVGGYADDADLETRASHLMDVARIVDAYILAVGCDVKDNTSYAIDLADFTDQLAAAIEGNAIFQLSRTARRIRESRYPHTRTRTARQR
jgi:hypothetical protein